MSLSAWLRTGRGSSGQLPLACTQTMAGRPPKARSRLSPARRWEDSAAGLHGAPAVPMCLSGASPAWGLHASFALGASGLQGKWPERERTGEELSCPSSPGLRQHEHHVHHAWAEGSGRRCHLFTGELPIPEGQRGRNSGGLCARSPHGDNPGVWGRGWDPDAHWQVPTLQPQKNRNLQKQRPCAGTTDFCLLTPPPPAPETGAIPAPALQAGIASCARNET